MQVQSEKIPQYLRENGRFCNWRYEDRDGSKTKVPYIPGTNRRASVNNPSTFTAFDTAASATGYDGIGIRVCGKIVGIDLDHCIEEGDVLPWAQDIVNRFRATYIEVSPSGTGIRIFCLLPDGFSYDAKTYYIKKGNIEVYIPGHTNRFLTVTGNALTNADVAETGDALTWLLETHMRRPTPSLPSVAAPGKSYLQDDAVISKASAARNGDKFRRLWNGDASEYKSQSEADAALLATLAFWCSGDKEQMDRLFRQSGLMREKWNAIRGADTYGNISIEKAVSHMTDFYKPIIPRSAAEDFGMERLKGLDPTDTTKYPWNDIGAGHIFADFYQSRLRYVPERKMWFYYEGGIWQPDVGSLRAMKYCMELADLMYTFALEIRDTERRKSYIKYANRWQSHSERVNILKDAQVYHPISYGSFDADIYIFNCKTIMSSLAQEESRSISDNVTWGQRKRFADGKVNMPFSSFLGYRRGEDGMPEIVPEEAETVRTIYKLFIGGKTVNAIAKHLTTQSIPTPRRKAVWQSSTIESILTNEKYKGDAVLQKKFTVDFLNKRMKVNEGEVPQYYVTDSHPAIIGKAEWDLVQAEMAKRKAKDKHQNSLSPFAAKIICGDCGGYFGSKLWHSTDKYRRTVWQCNGKYRGESKCRTPHLNEDRLKELFLEAAAEFLADRDALLEDCTEMRDFLADTASIDREMARLAEEMDTISLLIERLIADNATKAINQEEYNKKYDALEERFNTAQKRYDKLQGRKVTLGFEVDVLECFMFEISALPELPVVFCEHFWNNMIDHVTVYHDDRVIFTFKNGGEVTKVI